MRFNGGSQLSWSRIERILSGRPGPTPVPVYDAPEKVSEGVHRQAKRRAQVPFAELHATSCYSFLTGASEPEEIVERAVELGLEAVAIVDRDGFYGLMKFAEAAALQNLPTVYGVELSLGEKPTGLLALARGPEGYRRLSRLVAQARMVTKEKDEVRYPSRAAIAEQLGDECVIVAGYEWAEEIDALVAEFGAQNVVLEYAATLSPEDTDHHEILDEIRARHGLRAIATALPAAANRTDARLAAAKRALARRESLEKSEPAQHPMGAQWLRSGQQMLTLMPDRGEEIAYTVELAHELAFTWDALAPNLPHCDVPEGFDEMSWLRELVRQRAPERYRAHPRSWEKAQQQIEHELAVIEKLGFPGYFLIVTDIVDFCARSNILCQGRGSAANSVVCFVLGITNAEPISAQLLFERFLSPDRDGPPDIDVDIESGRREEVIQYVYSFYGRDRAAQVANVITYRRKGALRDAARALGYPQGAGDAWSKGIAEPPEDVSELAEKFRGQPRHLGIHSGGMVLCDRPIADVVPMEWARMEDRSVLQWDKDDCAAAGLVKFDLLGLGMLEAIHHMVDLVKETRGKTINLWELDLADPGVYAMLSRADAVGVFQVESRAQLATLPRLKPRRFFDLVVEVALIRPGPIQGGSVHPYLRRRNGEEEITYDHPVLEKSLGKTLGIPLFQEQLMQIAVDAAGFSGAEADELRRAMGSKRSPQRMEALRQRFFNGLWETNQIDGEVALTLWNKIVAFAAYGFPESHAQSFASLVYFSAWFKCFYPAEFCVGLLRAQPMGFYSPQSLIQDARRHGVRILPVDVNASGTEARIEKHSGKNGDDDFAIRIGLNLVQGLSKVTDRIEEDAPYKDMADLARRADLTTAHLEALAKAGALDGFGLSRRQALWNARVAATEREGMLPGLTITEAPALPGMSLMELVATDISATGVTHNLQPMQLIRPPGVLTAAELKTAEDGSRIRVAGIVTHRQRPQTASGVTFFGLEDETGLINVMVTPGLWKRNKVVARTAKALIIRGIVSNANGAATVTADKLEALDVGTFMSRGSRDFQ
ncbi:DNA polymerase [Corynebacterium ammoniagenes DSM 20306]|uniref:error-prone DNA polymerase n=1 Tax=Corynebacterium ammoniagenes TaxID=1697 RepID=UPI000950806A|nr:error-prone DNA polymerase [Corynebacterium ammoniagenes]APT81929.1 DNA polymerase [Corynebacterium ammoniagenes DSM 20306]AQS73046.1 error-prone DNA polymerase [Corynebacterium ammoniagenes]